MINPYAALIEQNVHYVPTFTLESGVVLRNVPVAYKTWGKLNEARDNVMLICHAFAGSSAVEDWWGPLLGVGKAFDPSRYFIFCANAMGSPYGSASPLTINPDTGAPYGPEFPLTTIRDDVRLHKLVLDHLGVSSVAVVTGGSMGGMATLEWPLCTPTGYIRNIIPIAISARHSAWCICWSECQRQSIYSDPAYEDGYYVRGKEPNVGLAAARMAALLTYRSRESFESRFGRKPQKSSNGVVMAPLQPLTHPADEALATHNEGHRNAKPRPPRDGDANGAGSPQGMDTATTRPNSPPVDALTPRIFSAQSYLRYHGNKFTARFDANCYIHITRKLDTHDISRGRYEINSPEDEPRAVAAVLRTLPKRALVIGIPTDVLYLLSEQCEIAENIPDAELAIIDSPHGHDGFLLAFEEVNTRIMNFLKREYPSYYKAQPTDNMQVEGFEVKQTSIFGEAEVDVSF